MSLRLLVLMSLVSVVGCGSGSARECQFNSDCPAGRYCDEGRCTADCASDGECEALLGAGAVCSSFGMCVAPPDAGPGTDAGPPRDAGPSDAGADAGPDAGPPREVCTPSTPAGTLALDEDGDGAIDEGCPWYFGRPHLVTHVHDTPSNAYCPQLSEDGLRLYFTILGAGLYVSTREAVDRAFGPPAPVATTSGWDSVTPICASLSRDELEVFFQASASGAPEVMQVWRSVRSSRADPWGSPAVVDAVEAVPGYRAHPDLSWNGLELFFVSIVSDEQLWVTSRPSRTEPFGPARPLSPSGNRAGWGPGLAPDGETFFFSRGITRTLFRALRTGPGETDFADVEQVVELNEAGTFADTAHVSAYTREIFFAVAGRTWNIPTWGIWRAQICRDGPCVEPRVACDLSTGAVPSPDGFHCYFSRPATTWDGAVRACASAGAHLATIHSRDEISLIATRWGPDPLWIGGSRAADGTWRWDWPERVARVDPEEPFLAAFWNPGEPNGGADERCAVLVGSVIGDTDCTRSYTAICEDDTWPTW